MVANKSSHRRCSIKKSVLKSFAIFRAKYSCWSLLNKVAGLQACNFIKKKLQHRYFPVNITKCLRTPILPKKHLRTAASEQMSGGSKKGNCEEWTHIQGLVSIVD